MNEENPNNLINPNYQEIKEDILISYPDDVCVILAMKDSGDIFMELSEDILSREEVENGLLFLVDHEETSYEIVHKDEAKRFLARLPDDAFRFMAGEDD